MIIRYHIPPPETHPELDQPSPCTHRNIQLVRFKNAAGIWMYQHQCQICGESTSDFLAYASLSDEQRKCRLRNEDLRTQFCKQRAELWAKWRRGKNQAWWTWYAEYLESQVWKERREAVLQRAGGWCEACRYARAVMAHHLTYKRAGREPLFDLVAVCEDCHRELHGETHGCGPE